MVLTAGACVRCSDGGIGWRRGPGDDSHWVVVVLILQEAGSEKMG